MKHVQIRGRLCSEEFIFHRGGARPTLPDHGRLSIRRLSSVDKMSAKRKGGKR